MKIKLLCLIGFFTFGYSCFSQKNVSADEIKKIEKNGLTFSEYKGVLFSGSIIDCYENGKPKQWI